MEPKLKLTGILPGGVGSSSKSTGLPALYVLMALSYCCKAQCHYLSDKIINHLTGNNKENVGGGQWKDEGGYSKRGKEKYAEEVKT